MALPRDELELVYIPKGITVMQSEFVLCHISVSQNEWMSATVSLKLIQNTVY